VPCKVAIYKLIEKYNPFGSMANVKGGAATQLGHSVPKTL
jgi:hypothetical protein